MSDIQEVYEHLLKNGFSEEDLQKKIKSKEREFHGFITKQGALFLIAKEFGLDIHSPGIDQKVYQEIEHEIDYNEFHINAIDVKEKMANIVLLGKIVQIFPLKEFIKKDGTPGIVGSFLFADKTGVLKIVLWNQHSKIMKSEYFTEGTIIRIINGYSKVGYNEKVEVHLPKKSRIVLDPEDISKKTQDKLNQLNLNDFDLSAYREQQNTKENCNITIDDLFKMDGFVKSIAGFINKFSLKEFTKKNGEKSFLLKLELADKTGLIIVNIWDMKAIEILRIIEKGMAIKLINLFLKKNTYTDQKELQFTNKSLLEIL
jgi:replication factor A1